MDAVVATIDLPFVKTYRDRHGRRRCYFRRRGHPTVTLPLPSEPGFLEAYDAAKSGQPVAGGAGAAQTVPGSISALIVAYYASAEWADLRESTRTGYRNMLDRFRDAHGTKRVSAVEPRHLEAIFHAMAATPGAAGNLRKRLRRVFRLAVRLGWRKDNPVTETEAPRRRRAGGFTPWTEDEIAKYEARWPSGTRERMAMALLLYVGVRRSDAVGLGRQHAKAGRMHVLPLKTSASGKRLAIKIHPALQREIDLTPADQLAFILTAFGIPFTAAGFTAWFRERAEMAGIVGRTPHGLRKAAGRRMAEAGCTAKEIAAVLGHATLAEVETYTADADQARLADAAVAKLGDTS